MKTVIVLQNSQAFSINIAEIFDQTHYRLFLFVNLDSFNKLKERQQDILFEKITITEFFTLEYLIPYINELIQKHPENTVEIITNSEWCVNVCGQLRSYYNLPGLDNVTSNRYTNKLAMKDALQSINVHIPKYISFNKNEYEKNKSSYLDKITSTLKFPMFVKPIDDANSNGTAILDNVDVLQKWLEFSNEKQSFEFDEYIQGKLFHCDSFIKNNHIIYSQVSEYTFPVFEYLQGKPLGSITLPESSKDFIEIAAINEKIIEALGYQGSGVTHLEIFKTSENDFVFLEIAARPGGAWLPQIYKKHLRINLFESHFLLQINKNFNLDFNVKGPYSACIWFPCIDGIIESFFQPEIKSQYELKYYTQEGQCVNKSSTLREKSAEIFIYNNNFSELYNDFLYLKNFNPTSFR